MAKRAAKFTKIVIGNATLYHGDCFDVLDHLQQIDIVVTSPPYNQLQQGKPSGLFKTRKWLVKALNGYPDSMPEDIYQKYICARLDKCFSQVRGLMWVNHKTRYRRRRGIHPLRIFNYPLHQEIVWDQLTTMAMNGDRFDQTHEYIFGFGLPHYWNKIIAKQFRSVWRIKTESTRNHPCVFPEKIIEPIIIASSYRGDVVLDPFAGEGRTGIVALKNARRCILIEKNEKYFAQMVRNIENLYGKLK